MPKYKVKFKIAVQVDGWSDWRDRDFQDRSETITVEAKNLKHARKVAIKNSRGYHAPAYWGYGHTYNWCDNDIMSVKRLKKREVNNKAKK